MKNFVRTEDAAPYVSNRAKKLTIPKSGLVKEEEDAIIATAMDILKNRMKEPGETMSSPDVVRNYLKLRLTGYNYELFYVMFLDNQHSVIHSEAMFRGTIDCASVYPREVVVKCLELSAKKVILAHNHPSGISEYSSADIEITRKLEQALGLLDIGILDHFIVGREITSMKENGVI